MKRKYDHHLSDPLLQALQLSKLVVRTYNESESIYIENQVASQRKQKDGDALPATRRANLLTEVEPWLQLDGSIDIEFLRELKEKVLSMIMKRPGIYEVIRISTLIITL